MKIATSTEKLYLQPFGNVQISETGTLAYVGGNAPFVNVEENGDIVPLRIRQCLPFSANALRIFNPFSFAITIFIARGIPISLPSAENPAETDLNAKSLASAVYYTGVTAGIGKKRGVAFFARRGRYRLSIAALSVTTGFRILTLRNAPANFMDAKDPLILSDTPPVNRLTGVPHDQIMCAAGYLLDADLPTWITNSGADHSFTETFLPVYTVDTVGYFGEDTAIVITSAEAASFQLLASIYEMGDPKSEKRV